MLSQTLYTWTSLCTSPPCPPPPSTPHTTHRGKNENCTGFLPFHYPQCRVSAGVLFFCIKIVGLLPTVSPRSVELLSSRDLLEKIQSPCYSLWNGAMVTNSRCIIAKLLVQAQIFVSYIYIYANHVTTILRVEIMLNPHS